MMPGLVAFVATLSFGGVLIYAAWPKEPPRSPSSSPNQPRSE